MDSAWLKLADKTLTQQFLSFPVSKKRKKNTIKVNLDSARIDVYDTSELIQLLDEFKALCEDEAQVALQKIFSQLKSNKEKLLQIRSYWN